MADSEAANYDISVIDVSPAGMDVTAKALVALSLSVAERIGTIHTTLNGLRVAWQGQAATDAEKVQNEWTRVMTELFGTEEDPSLGVLPALADGVGMAWGNFSVAEQGVIKIFTEFITNLTATGGGDPEEVTDTNRTAVTMTFPY
ncbi:WXG100 family type VII secretion target (plasmid) [Streptomyces scopuliridis]|uniref:WXG100 family type VII secretion target n=1 Tax=Streptomyces scopuliridis TaxID=452529 RepID=UPI002DDC1B36|nr:WXG100 family type VII secretion target [Streptomyces scopuliridis]WSB39256.1 WXG100 family type VII secretion target [Streptomyces scopuliridis]